jgi:hypothetical protein
VAAMTVAAEVWKDGERVAEALSMRTHVLVNPFEGIKRLNLFFFPKLLLAPSVLTYVLNGRALGHYLDQCGVRLDPEGENPQLIDGLRYVHGNVPKPLVKNEIYSVLVAEPLYEDVPIPGSTFLTYLPEIYRRFLSIEENR